jgi:hypothetical protein
VTDSTPITTATVPGELLRTYDKKREKRRTAAQKKALRGLQMKEKANG